MLEEEEDHEKSPSQAAPNSAIVLFDSKHRLSLSKNKAVPDATLASFCDGYQDFLILPRLMHKFTEMDHVQNVEKLWEQLAVLSDCSL